MRIPTTLAGTWPITRGWERTSMLCTWADMVRVPIYTTFIVVALCVALGPANAAEPDALAISANIQARHMPFGTILDPVFASPASNDITAYTHCGDSALWTGAYLAAEAFRYKVTQ